MRLQSQRAATGLAARPAAERLCLPLATDASLPASDYLFIQPIMQLPRDELQDCAGQGLVQAGCVQKCQAGRGGPQRLAAAPGEGGERGGRARPDRGPDDQHPQYTNLSPHTYPSTGAQEREGMPMPTQVGRGELAWLQEREVGVLGI